MTHEEKEVNPTTKSCGCLLEDILKGDVGDVESQAGGFRTYSRGL